MDPAGELDAGLVRRAREGDAGARERRGQILTALSRLREDHARVPRLLPPERPWGRPPDRPPDRLDIGTEEDCDE